jgi:hypothetical protein
MALNREAMNQKWIFWFIVDGAFAYDDKGWMMYIRTPLFGLSIKRNWQSFVYMGRTNRFWGGLISRWPTDMERGDSMYVWNWEREKAVRGKTVYAYPQDGKAPTRLEMVRRTLRDKWWPRRKRKPDPGVAPGDGDSQTKSPS